MAVLDACVLIPYRLSTTLLWLAEAGLFQPLWSDSILDEVERNLPGLGVSPRDAQRRVGAMREAFGAEALVENFGHLVGELTCDPKDRHVLAVAVHDEADVLITFNVKDFPRKSTEPHGVEVLLPDSFLVALLAERPGEVIRALEIGVGTLRNPPEDLRDWLASLTETVPTFANLTADVATAAQHPETPVPALVIADPDEAMAAFGEPGDFTNPAQVAMAWWWGLQKDLAVARRLTWRPKAWRGYRWAVEHLAERSLASKVIPTVDAPDDIVFMRFISEVAHTSQVIESYATSVTFLILVKVDDETWRVWGLGPALVSAKNVKSR